MTKPKGRRHRVAKEGPKVFPSESGDERPVVLVPVGGVLLKCRFPSGKPIREVSMDEYGGQPKPPEPAA